MDSFTIELVSKTFGELFPNNTLNFLTNFLPEQKKIGGASGGCIFRIILPINVLKNNGREIQVL